MMDPAQFSKAKLYKGAAFSFSFRLKRAGAAITPDSVIFTASDKPGGTSVFEFESGDSPARITVDDEQIWTVEIPADETDYVEQGELYMQVDAVEDGVRRRWIVGNIKVYPDATAD